MARIRPVISVITQYGLCASMIRAICAMLCPCTFTKRIASRLPTCWMYKSYSSPLTASSLSLVRFTLATVWYMRGVRTSACPSFTKNNKGLSLYRMVSFAWCAISAAMFIRKDVLPLSVGAASAMLSPGRKPLRLLASAGKNFNLKPDSSSVFSMYSNTSALAH